MRGSRDEACFYVDILGMTMSNCLKFWTTDGFSDYDDWLQTNHADSCIDVKHWYKKVKHSGQVGEVDLTFDSSGELRLMSSDISSMS